MNIIYSSTHIEGLDGAYRNPALFGDVDTTAEVVYTDHNHIKEAYEAAGVKVEPITKPKRRTKKESK